MEQGDDAMVAAQSLALKRLRDDNLEPETFIPSSLKDRFNSGFPGTGRGLPRPPKKFASDIKFGETQDLNFEQLNTDDICRDRDQRSYQRESFSHAVNFLKGADVNASKSFPSNYSPDCKNTHSKNPLIAVNNHPVPLLLAKQQIVASENLNAKTVIIERENASGEHQQQAIFECKSSISHFKPGSGEHQQQAIFESKTSISHFKPEQQKSKLIPETCEISQPQIDTGKHVSVDSIQGATDDDTKQAATPESETKRFKVNGHPISQHNVKPGSGDLISERTPSFHSDAAPISESVKNVLFPCNEKKTNALSSPVFKATFPNRHAALLRTTKLTVINENEVSEDNPKPSPIALCLEKDSKRIPETDTRTEMAGECQLITPKGCTKVNNGINNGTSVVPYGGMPTDHAVSGAEWELCMQWLNKDRFKTLDSLKQQSQHSKATEASLCQELEQMLRTTKQILQNELEFSVRLCSTRGQCLLFQKSTRLHFEHRP